jgi:PAS domain S-box-containing protein
MSEATESNGPFAEFVANRLDDYTRHVLVGQSAVICSAEEGNRVLYVSDEFERHTGYTAAEAIGRNLSFLQGPATEAAAVKEFRRLIDTATPGMVRITNYRKDGALFLHECEFRPVFDASGKVTHFVTIQRPA